MDYRAFVTISIKYLKIHRKFSARQFANRSGFKSPSYLKMILDGKRNLTLRSTRQLAQGLSLNKSEAMFLEVLVLFNQAKSEKEREGYYKNLLTFKKFLKIQKTGAEQYDYYSNWYNVIIREAVAGKWGKKPLTELASALGISERQLEESLKLLEGLSLIERSKNGFNTNSFSLETPREIQSMVVRSFHRQMIHKALDALDHLPQESRDISSLTISVKHEKLAEIKKRVAQFRRELNAEYSGDANADQVFQLNFQVFPLLNIDQRKDGSDENS